ncbi:MAG: acetolactate decarboxylase [Bacteroidetes bacterium]|nr:acetolactate decarboxylase [Bacteroidota bacterium]MBU1116700.1 acetolactate decarboxylase [Bacteroidota bacterium]MBU1800064.1 acetolactate decarboxylase [Bacteroidota bacterium]
MKNIFAVILLFAVTSCVNEIENNSTSLFSDNIYQYSTKNALISNDYTGDLTVGEIKKKGNFGIGTFNMVDGEMVIYDGNVYQVLPNGSVNNMPSDVKSPFVVTKYFEADTTFTISNISLDSLKALFKPLVENMDYPFAIKIDGTFESLKSRSVDKVTDESISLEQIVANQTVFDFTNVDGKVIGFWYPQYFDGVNFTEYHLHALLNNFKGGGHLLDCKFVGAVVEIDFASGVIVEL